MNKIVLATSMLITATTASAQTISYPTAPSDNTVDEYWGTQVPDPFRPLENDTSEATSQWVAAENAVTQTYLSKIPQRAKILKRLREVGNYEKIGVPFEKNGKWYQYKNNGL